MQKAFFLAFGWFVLVDFWTRGRPGGWKVNTGSVRFWKWKKPRKIDLTSSNNVCDYVQLDCWAIVRFVLVLREFYFFPVAVQTSHEIIRMPRLPRFTVYKNGINDAG
jgi:hypothetical protein